MPARFLLPILAALALVPSHARAGKITAAELAAKLQQPGPHPVLIDIRATAEYQEGSIPGAINIPGRVLLQKRMRFAHGCVLVSDGIADKVNPAELADALGKQGVSPADYLDGGMAAWTALGDAASTTHRVGAREARGPRSITYEDLAKRDGETCLIDLRPAGERVVPKNHTCPVRGICSQRHFTYYPNLQRFHASRRQAKGTGTMPLIVLISGEDTGLADTELEKLFLEGYHRSAVLLGGAEILAHEGRRGLKRHNGATLELPESPSPNP
jgi:rhodanese-related sulfurtransferase